MSIFKEDPGENSVLIPTKIVRDPNLSLKEKGFLATLYAQPEDAHFAIKEISADGKACKRTVFNKLIAKGYIVPCRTRDKNGRYGRTDLILKIPDEEEIVLVRWVDDDQA